MNRRDVLEISGLRATGPSKMEYLVVYNDDGAKAISEKLTNLAADEGWELIAVIGHGYSGAPEYVMARRVPLEATS